MQVLLCLFGWIWLHFNILSVRKVLYLPSHKLLALQLLEKASGPFPNSVFLEKSHQMLVTWGCGGFNLVIPVVQRGDLTEEAKGSGSTKYCVDLIIILCCGAWSVWSGWLPHVNLIQTIRNWNRKETDFIDWYSNWIDIEICYHSEPGICESFVRPCDLHKMENKWLQGQPLFEKWSVYFGIVRLRGERQDRLGTF